ncbi:ATP-binding protein [Roseovarius sp. SCSIO 43702]|uniref:ATP-binding protein n=1 Tax=Roseovarius sp. SCSIO 43702 TaxID=2823043 RepID=UPI002175B35E|nr:ATP-binding protein [Roseovarius sp. SCSIO 43702]
MTDTWSENGFECAFDATHKAVRSALSDIRAWTWARGFPDAACGTVELVLAEALNNIVEHACADIPGARITVKATLFRHAMLLTVTDPGRHYPDHVLPEGEPPVPDVPRKDLPEGGFGWFLIRQLTRSLIYRREPGGNHLSMMFDITER